MKKVLALALLLAVTAGCGGGGGDTSSSKTASSAPAEKAELHVSAAASLTDVMNEIGAAYEKEHPNVKLVFNYGSSGALQQAIENGGGADLFFSAAQKQMDALEAAGLLAEGTRRELLVNEVVLIVPKEGGEAISSFDQLPGAAVKRVALGEPKGVPVGQYSEEILTRLGIEGAVKAKAVYGSDVRQVLTWVESGDVDAGLVYATDAAISEKVRVVAKAPADSHKPIVYPAAVLKETKQMALAKDFLAFVASDASRKRFETYGFEGK